MSAAYDPLDVERRVQAFWDEHGTNLYTDEDLLRLGRAGRKFYNLMMFPYPSAEGLHVGNIYAFTGADVYGRFKRLQGYDVFEPIGFDAFGIHSENYALKVGVHPMELIPRNIARFREQLRRMGFMYDWHHTVDTTDPGYYRWTQWLFLQFYKAGLAVKREAPVNWCPSCQTVLANEQVVGGLCERCDTPVELRQLSQWFFRITAYAERLLENLKRLDWSESTKKLQEHWIGRSEGAEIRFPVLGRPGLEIAVFTTRPDTVFGATYLVLAPEHPLVDEVTAPERRGEVEAYRARVRATDLVSRKKVDKAKTGVDTGARARNPATGEEIPIWIADYVLMEYGTGAIMAVPGHDERDFEFAQAFGLPIRRVVVAAGEDPEAPLPAAYTGSGRLVHSGPFDGLPTDEAKTAIVRWLSERGAAEPRVTYRLHDWCISRQRYWGPPIPIVYCDACGIVPVPEEELPVQLPYLPDPRPDGSGRAPLARLESWYRTRCPRCGGEARRETDVSDTFLDSAWYFLRYPSANVPDRPFDPELTRLWLPVDMYIGGNEHATMHLLYSRFVTMVLHDLGYLPFEEPFVRFRAHGLIVKDGAKMSKSRGNVVVPDEYLARYGADTFRLYLMFLGPYEEGGDFRDAGIAGPHNFLRRVWEAVHAAEDRPLDSALERKLHATIRKVTEDLETLNYNTAIAALMEYLNAVRAHGRVPERAAVEPLVVMLAPLAPHIAEALWWHLGGTDSIFVQARWPRYDPAKAEADAVEVVVQINGRVRARLPMRRGASEAEVRAAALAHPQVRRQLDGAQLQRVIFVPDRLINLVVG
jgi:leucyl-tRNA synthetase